MHSQPLVQEGVVCVKEIRHRTVFLHHAVHKQLGFFPHGLAKNVVEVRIFGGHRSLRLQGAQAEPLPREITH